MANLEQNPLKQWDVNSWVGGYSDDRYLGIKDSFQSARKIEIRENPRSIKLANLPEKQSVSVVTDLILAFVTIKSTGDIIAFGDTGKVYRNAGGAGTWVNCYTDTNGKITNALEYNGYLYWTTAGKLGRISIADIDNTWAGSASLNKDYQSFAVSNSNIHPMVEKFNNLYIGSGSDLAELDSLGAWDSSVLSIFSDEEICLITFSGDTFRIYARKTTVIEASHLYLWNGISDSYNLSQDIDGVYIHGGVCFGNFDYIVAGKRPTIYAMSGLEKVVLKKIPLISQNQTCYLYHNAFAIVDNLMLFGIEKSGTNSLDRGVFSFGQRDKNYSLSLNCEFLTSQAGATDIIGAVHNSTGNIYFGWKSGSVYGIDKVNTAKYPTSGDVISRVFDGNEPASKKNGRMIKIAFTPLNAGEKIEVYVRKNLGSDWGTAVLAADYANTEDRNVNFKTKMTGIDAWLTDASCLETKIVLYSGTSGATTPELILLSLLTENTKPALSN